MVKSVLFAVNASVSSYLIRITVGKQTYSVHIPYRPIFLILYVETLGPVSAFPYL